MHRELDIEVDCNFEAFLTLLPGLLAQRRGEFAVLRHGVIEDYHPTEHGALSAGRRRFTDGLFSIQEITDRPADLGFFSHAINPRIA